MKDESTPIVTWEMKMEKLPPSWQYRWQSVLISSYPLGEVLKIVGEVIVGHSELKLSLDQAAAILRPIYSLTHYDWMTAEMVALAVAADAVHGRYPITLDDDLYQWREVENCYRRMILNLEAA